MLRSLLKVFAILVMVSVGAFLRYWHGDAIRDAIHNLIVNRAMGTSGVDYANHLNPQKYDFRYDSSGQMVNVGKRAQRGSETTVALPPREEELGTGWSGLAVSGARKSERKELREPDASSGRLVRTDGVLSASAKHDGRSTTVHSTGAEIHYSPFEKTKRSKSRSSTSAP
jgi:hypothetical protein